MSSPGSGLAIQGDCHETEVDQPLTRLPTSPPINVAILGARTETRYTTIIYDIINYIIYMKNLSGDTGTSYLSPRALFVVEVGARHAVRERASERETEAEKEAETDRECARL